MRKSFGLSLAVVGCMLCTQAFAQNDASDGVAADQEAVEQSAVESPEQPAAVVDAAVVTGGAQDKDSAQTASAADTQTVQPSPSSQSQPWTIPMGDAVLAPRSSDQTIIQEPQTLAEKTLNYITDRFRFGSYGRVQPSMDPESLSSGHQASIVSPRPRVDEGTYVEITLGYTPYRDENGTEVEVVTTLALDGAKLFHYDGNWDASLAIRNLYVEARNLWFDGFTVWAGSRMYRGDDIYLLDFWPLDNLNTYGGGIGWHGKTRTNIDLHFGTNRLTNGYQYEVISTESSRYVGTEDVVYLDRQRFIASLKAEQQWGTDIQFKAKLYGEVHAIKEGEWIETQPELIKKLPSDSGWLIGAEFGMWNFLDDSFLNVFLKYGRGLAAYGEMAVPFGFSSDLKASGASQFLFGLSTGLDFKYVNVLAAGYVRYFADADGISEDYDDGVDGVWDIRITGRIGKYFAPGIELSQQLRHANGVNPETLSQDLASVFKFSLLPAVRFGDGILARPEIRVNYTLSVLNDAARYMFNEKDHLRDAKIEHFLGIAAEWWFNI